jgi:2-octaprenyl-6-methoxyphenol hydroxylase
LTSARVALIGDAAHAIHPIAGQGLNLGLKDVAALAEVAADARRLGEDWGSDAVLDRYVRWRRFDAAALAAATDLFNRLFSNDDPLVRAVRGAGLSLVDRLGPIPKRLFAREAGAALGDLPRLLRGEAL